VVSFVAAVATVVALSACVPRAHIDAAEPSKNSDATESATFVAVIDGDTIETSAGTVRLIGIDTPERSECGHGHASAVISGVLAPGDTVTLVLPAGQNDQDRHGRLIRYVKTPSGVDLGMLQLESGNAVARYDSRDGYPAHPREEDYHAAQQATVGADGSVITVGCHAAAFAPPAADGWWEQYSSCAKLKRNDVGHPVGPFSRDDPAQAEIYEWFAIRTGNGGDGDGDGLACE
jgi:micrococcal nuclease